MLQRDLFTYKRKYNAMINSLFFRGLFIGISLGLPAIPMNTLCIKRSLNQGLSGGLATALGIACADFIYSLIAAMSVTALTHIIMGQKAVFFLMGSLSLFYIGYKSTSYKTCLSTGIFQEPFIKTLTKTMALTLANPLTLAVFTGTFASLGIAQTGLDLFSLALLSSGVFLGSTIWFSMVSTGLSLARSRFSLVFLQRINTISGWILIACSFILFIKFILSFT
jgi:threonine/homoserine/homoserine lactone efflux protein